MSAPDIFSQSPSHCSTFKIHPVEMDLSSEPPPARRVRRMTASAINKIESPTINRQVSELAKHLDNFIPTGTRGKGEKQPPDAPSSNAIVLLEQTVSDRYIEPTTKQTLATLAGPALDSPGASRLCPAETPEPLHLPRKSSVEQDWTDGTREVVIDTEIGPQLFALGSDFKVAPDENQSDLSVSHDVFSESEREMETEKWLLDEISAKNREIESLQREKRADAFEIAKLKRNFHSKLRELEQVSQAEQEWLRQANLDLEKSLSYSIQAREQVENRINQFGNDPNDPSHDSELVSRLEAQIFVAANEIKAQKEQNDDLLQNTVRLNARIMEMEYQISTERNSSIVSKKTLDLVQLDPQAELRLIQNERDELREKVTYEIRESNNQNEHINDIRHDPDLTSRLEAQLVDAVNEAKVQQEQNEKLAQTIVKLSAKMQEIQSQFKTEREIVVLSKKTLESTQLEAQAELSLLQRDLDELREKLTSSEAQNTKKQNEVTTQISRVKRLEAQLLVSAQDAELQREQKIEAETASKETLKSAQIAVQAELSLLQNERDELCEKLAKSEAQKRTNQMTIKTLELVKQELHDDLARNIADLQQEVEALKLKLVEQDRLHNNQLMSYQDIWSFKVTELETIITEKDELVKFMKKALLDSENRYSDLKIDYLELVSRHQSWSLMDQEKNVTVTQLGVPMAEKNDGTEQFKEALEGMESFNLQIVEINAKVIDEEDSQDSLSRSLTTSCQFSGPKNIDAQLAGANHEVESDADAKNPLDLSRSQSKEMNLDDGQPLFDITAADSYSQSKLSMTQTQSRSESTGSNMVLESRTLAAASRPPAKLKLVEATIESIKTEMRISLKPVLDSMRSPKETSSSDLIPKIGGLNDWEIPDKIEDAWIVPIKTNMQDALKEIDILMHQEKDNIRLISKFRPGPMGAVVLREGEIAVWNGHHISVSMQPGYYWNSKKWIGNFDTTKPLRVQGLTASLVSPNEVAVVIGPGKLVFIAKPPGFAAFTLKDSFQLLEFVNIKELGSETLITEKLPNGKPGAVLGRKKEVLSDDQSVANFYEVPAKVVLILKNDDELILLRTGLHVVTNSKIKFHGFYSIGDTIQFTTEPVKTSDGIQVILEVAVKYKVTDPLLLASNYGSLLEALRCPTQAAVSALLTRMTFSQFQRSQQITRKDVTFSSEDNQLDNLKSATLEEFQKVMKEFGIDVRAFYGWSL